MKQLTKSEIDFIKETGWCPTLYQMNYSEHELQRTIYRELSPAAAINAFKIKAKEFGVDVAQLYEKCTKEHDGISLEYEATYLFYTFFTKEQLERLTDLEAAKWLQDFQYFCGYRKWGQGLLPYIQEALDVYNGNRIFYLEDDGEVWNISKVEHPSSWVWDKPERILKI